MFRTSVVQMHVVCIVYMVVSVHI